MSTAVVRRYRRLTAAAIAGALVVTYFVVRSSGPSPHHYSAILANASELVPQNAVRINDVEVGKVKSLSVQGLHAKVDFTVNPSVKLPADTGVELKQTSLLGEMYLALEPAGQGVLKDGAVIPLSRTRRASELEQVIGLGGRLVDQVTADHINNMMKTFDDAWGGRPQRLQQLFDAMSGASAAFNANRDALAATIDRVSQMADALAPHTDELAGSIGKFAAGMKALDEHKNDLVSFTEALRQLSETGTDLLNKNQAKLEASGRQTREILGQIVGHLNEFMVGVQSLPDFNLGWQCTVQGNWMQELQAVYPEVARIDTGGGHCTPDKGPRGREEQGQVQVTGVPQQQAPDDPAHTGDIDLGAGSANANSGRHPSQTRDGGLTSFMMTSAGS